MNLKNLKSIVFTLCFFVAYACDSKKENLPPDPVPEEQEDEETSTLDPRDADGSFSLAIIGDTQREVAPDKYDLFTERTEWIVKNKNIYDIRAVLHVGDVVNWDGAPVRNPWAVDEDDHCQYINAATALQTLRDANIPTSLCIGNHDSMVVGGGIHCGCTQTDPDANCGGARNENNIRYGLPTTGFHGRELQRMTESFNHYLDDAKLIDTWVAYEEDKVDNGYWTFEAVGAKWLVMNVELWPRTEVTAWARGIIEANQDKNVILQSHFIFGNTCNVFASTNFSEQYQYGDNSPALLWRELVEPHANVKIVASGHVTGNQCSKLITLPNGNKVIGTLTDVSNGVDFNPTRILQIDINKGEVRTWLYAPRNNATMGQNLFTGMNFIKG